LKNLFSSPVVVSAFLCANGAVLLVGERQREGIEPKGVDRAKQEQAFLTINDLTFAQAFFIGLSQSLALLPGISRSGISMVAALRAKLSHEEALRFTFLLASPAILLAALLEIPKDLLPAPHSTQIAAVAGGVAAFLAAVVSVRFLSRYFRVGRLTPFAYYCFVAGIVCFFIFAPITLGWFSLPWAGH
jgi:undecaprenyl-diphosphatase